MPGFNENVRVPFYSLSDLVLDRHLHLYFENNEREEVNSICDFDSGKLFGDKSNDSEFRQEINDNSAELKYNRLEGVFFSKNVINLLLRQLTKSEISLLLKGLKFLSTSVRIDKTKFKHRLEVFGKKLKSM